MQNPSTSKSQNWLAGPGRSPSNLPERFGAQSTNLNVSKRIEIRANPNVKIHVHISNSTWLYEDRKGKPVELQPAVESSRVEKPICQWSHA